MKDQYIEQLTTYIENAVYFMKQMENTSTAAFSLQLSNPELQVMIYLGNSGPRKMGEIADHLSLGLSNLTAIVDKLVGKNLVERYRSERDRRLVMVELTQEGNKIYCFQRDEKKNLSKQILQALSTEEKEQLLQLMKKASAFIMSGTRQESKARK